MRHRQFRGCVREGLDPDRSPLALWLAKTGRENPLPKDDPYDENSPSYWAHLLEMIVTTQYTKHIGHGVQCINAVKWHPDPALPWMLATIDWDVVGASDVQILACKIVGIDETERWQAGVPDTVQWEVMHQLAVTGQPAADIAVLLGNEQLQIHRIERDETRITRSIALPVSGRSWPLRQFLAGC